MVELEERAPQDFELRLTGIGCCLSRSRNHADCHQQMENEYLSGDETEPSPGILKKCPGARKIQIQEGIVRGFREFFILPGLYRGSYSEDRIPRRRGRSECL